MSAPTPEHVARDECGACGAARVVKETGLCQSCTWVITDMGDPHEETHADPAKALADEIAALGVHHLPGGRTVNSAIAAAIRAARAAAIEEAARWQPIETAPKDGTPLLLYGWETTNRPSLIDIGRWDGDYRKAWVLDRLDGSECEIELQATHWMPLPEPPTAAIRALGEESAAPREEESTG